MEKEIKAWIIINKYSGYPIWEYGCYFIFLHEDWGKAEALKKVKKETNLKVVPCIITLKSNVKQ